jgi:glycosyltransferase involved in cell wall biosynthesis
MTGTRNLQAMEHNGSRDKNPGKDTLLVSVIVPTYNRAHIIGRTLDSILKQSYTNIELIIVDDGSTDATESVVAACTSACAFPVRYHKKSNGGCSSARNLGVSLATGDALAFLDSDDEWLPDAIGSLVRVLEQSGADFVYSPCFSQVKDSRFVSYPAAAGHPERFAVEHFLTTRAYVCSLLYGKHVFAAYRNDESLRYNEDSDFLQRVAISFRAAYLETPTAVVHYHEGNKSSNRVEINRALLKSAENILFAFPAFRKQLGPLALQRVAGIVADLAGELIIEKRFAEARTLGASYRLGVVAKLSMVLGTRHLVRAARLSGRLAARGAGIVGRVTGGVRQALARRSCRTPSRCCGELPGK